MKHFFPAFAATVFCFAAPPTVVVAQTAFPSCVSDATDPDGDGYGYENSQTCLVNEGSAGNISNNCDYSDAALNDGWGYDAVSGQSCTPLGQQETQQETMPSVTPSSGLVSCNSSASDSDGDGYGWENGASCIVDSLPGSDPVSNVSDTGSTDVDAPVFTNLETGLEVDLVRADWVERDFTSNDVTCGTYEFDGAAYAFVQGTARLFQYEALPETPPFISTVTLNLDSNLQEPWGLENGVYSGPGAFTGAQWVEVDVIQRESSSEPRAVQDRVITTFWQSDASYTQCRTTNPAGRFLPTGGTSLEYRVGACDYSNEAQFDGWGWNAETSQSCAPLQQIIQADGSSTQDSLIAEFSGTLFDSSHTGIFTLTSATEVSLSGFHVDHPRGSQGFVTIDDSAGNEVLGFSPGVTCLEAGNYTLNIHRPSASLTNGVLPYEYSISVSDTGGDCTGR